MMMQVKLFICTFAIFKLDYTDLCDIATMFSSTFMTACFNCILFRVQLMLLFVHLLSYWVYGLDISFSSILTPGGQQDGY